MDSKIEQNLGVGFVDLVDRARSSKTLEEKDTYGRTSLIHAFELNRYFHAKILLDKGADPSAVFHGKSILDLAIDGKFNSMIRLASTYQPGMEPLNHVSQKCLVST